MSIFCPGTQPPHSRCNPASERLLGSGSGFDLSGLELPFLGGAKGPPPIQRFVVQYRLAHRAGLELNNSTTLSDFRLDLALLFISAIGAD